MKHWHMKIYKDRNREWRWTLRAGNGKKIATCGEGHKRRAHCERMVSRLFPWMKGESA